MGRKRKAVSDGITRRQPTRACRISSADVAEPSDAGQSDTTMSSNTRSRRTPRRGAVKDKWDESYLMTSTKSPLIKLDLVKLLARPEAWDILEESEKQEILDLLPDHVRPPYEPGEKIPPLSESFLRYSNHWRDGVRQFQIDLENGRYDPEWLRQAENAVEERAEGAYDNFKELEFEQFWGQKQKLDRSLAAGESSQIRLSTLIENGVVRTGDVWRLSRGFNIPGGRLLIEKEAKLMELNGSRMTCIVPAGQRLILPTVSEAEFQALLEAYRPTGSKKIVDTSADDVADVTDADDADDAADTGLEANEVAHEYAEASPIADGGRQTRSLRKRKSEISDTSRKKRQLEVQHAENGGRSAETVEAPKSELPTKRRGRLPKTQKPKTPEQNTKELSVVADEDFKTENPEKQNEEGSPSKKQKQEVPEQQKGDDATLIPDGQEGPQEKAAPCQILSVEIQNGSEEKDNMPSTIHDKPAGTTVTSETDDKPAPEPHTTRTVPGVTKQEDNPHSPSSTPILGGVEVAILWNVSGATSLCNKMVEVDGRITHIPNGNAWKEFRSYRDNQDMGSLWEVRQAWYAKQK